MIFDQNVYLNVECFFLYNIALNIILYYVTFLTIYND